MLRASSLAVACVCFACAGQVSEITKPVIISYSQDSWKVKVIAQVKVFSDSSKSTEVMMRRPMWGGKLQRVPVP
jgi:hypothetical protein